MYSSFPPQLPHGDAFSAGKLGRAMCKVSLERGRRGHTGLGFRWSGTMPSDHVVISDEGGTILASTYVQSEASGLWHYPVTDVNGLTLIFNICDH